MTPTKQVQDVAAIPKMLNGRRTRRAGVLALVAIATTVAVADGKVNKLTGSFPGDGDSKISMSLKLSKKGVAKKVDDIEYENVDLICPDGSTAQLSGSNPAAKVTEVRHGTFTFSSNTQDVSITGQVQGKKAVSGGMIATNEAGCGTDLDHGLPNTVGFTVKK